MSERVPESIRSIVATRAGCYCEYCYCSEQFATQSFTIEHIKPRQAGFTSCIVWCKFTSTKKGEK